MGILSAIGGIASAVIGANSARRQQQASERASERAVDASLMGFNYLKDNENVNQAQTQGRAAGGILSGQLGLNEGQNGQGFYSALLGMGGDQDAVNQAFGNYQNSTGYQFRMGQGMDAITGSAATRGLLNSGATLKSLNAYGQGMGSQEFQNYLGNYQQYLGQLQGAESQGLNAAFNVASSGGSGGANAAQSVMAGAANANAARQMGTESVVGGLGTALGGIGDMLQRQQLARQGSMQSGVY